MRHRLAGRHLNRSTDHRMAMMANLAVSLIRHEQVVTTLAKAKELRRYIEPLVTRARVEEGQSDLHARRVLLSRLKNREAVQKLMTVLAARYKGRPGGYTRVLRAGYRTGDSAPVGVIEFVDRDESAKGGKSPSE